MNFLSRFFNFSDISRFDSSSFFKETDKKKKNAAKLFRLLENHETHATVQFIKENEVDVEARSAKGDTLLHAVCRYLMNPSYVVIPMLLQKGASTTALDAKGLTPFDVAKNRGFSAATLSLLTQNIQPRILNAYRDEMGETLLTDVITYHEPSTVQSLVRAGVDVNMPNKSGDTPLDVAVRNITFWNIKKSSKIIEFLIKNNARLSLKNAVHSIKRLFQLENGIDRSERELFLKMRHLVFEKGINYTKTKDKNTLFHLYALNGREFYSFKSYDENIVAELAQHIDINAKNKDGLTPLLLAAKQGCSFNDFEMFIKNGADVYAKDNKGDTLLHYLSQKGDVKGAESVLTAYPKLALSMNNKAQTPEDVSSSFQMTILFEQFARVQEKTILDTFEALDKTKQLRLLILMAQMYPMISKEARQLVCSHKPLSQTRKELQNQRK